MQTSDSQPEADLLKDHLRSLQLNSLPIVALALVGAAAGAFLWIRDDQSQVQRWDLFGIVICLLAFVIWYFRNRYPQGTWIAAGSLVFAVLLAEWASGAPAPLLLLTLPCILVTSYLGLVKGVGLGLAISVLLVARSFLPGAVYLNEIVAISLVATWAGIVLIWAVLGPLRTATADSMYHSSISRQFLEESRDRQVELNQAYDDLRSAYSELGRLNQVLLATQRSADEARQTKELFVANVSHELRTPLNMIIGFSSMIAQAPLAYHRRLPAHLLADIAAIQRNAEHLSRLVDDVLDLSKADSGLMKLSVGSVSLATLLNEAVQPVEHLLASKGLWLKLDVEPDLPDVLCDATRVRQVVMNLLSNAGKLVEHGGITVCAYRASAEAVVSVEDTGPGIAPAEIASLFEPFHQLEVAQRPDKAGTGLGLAISKRLVEVHGGRMWVEAKPGAGATFLFTLPFAVAPAVGKPSRWLSAEYTLRERRHHRELPPIRKRLLFVDPEARLHSLALHCLRDRFELSRAGSIEAAMGDLRQSSAQLVILNESSGISQPALAQAMYALPQRVPIVACSAPGTLALTAQLGVDAYLVKPIPVDTLLAAVERIAATDSTILVVDDQPEVIQLFTRMLTSSGNPYTVLRAEDGRRALELIQQHHPQLVLLDLGMPGFSGREVLAALKQNAALSGTRVIVTSAQDPSGEPLVSEHLTLYRSSGFGGKEMMEVIGVLAEAVSPFQKSDDPVSPDTLAGSQVSEDTR